MATYYEMLQIEPHASQTEIETGIENQYNQWRRLVTHHDPNVVNQANQALQTIETIRETLTNPEKRRVYDTAVGVAGPVGGLADPSALLQTLAPQPMMTPPAPSPKEAVVPRSSSPALWECYKCHTDNPTGTKFCFKCSAQLVRQCPECENETSLVATGICGSCGYTYELASHRLELRQQISNLHVEIHQVEQEKAGVHTQGDGEIAVGCGGVLLFIGVFLLASTGSLFGAVILVLLGGFVLWSGVSRGRVYRATMANLNNRIKRLKDSQRGIEGEIESTNVA